MRSNQIISVALLYVQRCQSGSVVSPIQERDRCMEAMATCTAVCSGLKVHGRLFATSELNLMMIGFASSTMVVSSYRVESRSKKSKISA